VSRGLITHIQRFSVHDGPGIQTTVFLKGCQMHCAWCHNPETYRRQPELQVFADRCIGCGACVERCPHQAHQVAEGRHVYDRQRCVACGRCAETCYAKGLILVGETRSAEEVLDAVRIDLAFYQSSGGGVTISGGEPLVQPDFTRDVLELCKASGIHTAIETNLAVPWQKLLPLLPVVDLFLVDVKLLDDAEHRAWTGASNQNTLENLRQLDRERRPVFVRTPVIGGVNDRPDQIGAIADWLGHRSNVLQYDLLPYHPLGSGKYEALGRPGPPDSIYTPSPEAMEELAARAAGKAFEVRIAGEPLADRSRLGHSTGTATDSRTVSS